MLDKIVMAIRHCVSALETMGRLPTEQASVHEIQKFQCALGAISSPVTDDEALVLMRIFGEDDCFGLAWTLLHLIESAPSWSKMGAHIQETNQWANTLKQRIQNSQ